MLSKITAGLATRAVKRFHHPRRGSFGLKSWIIFSLVLVLVLSKDWGLERRKFVRRVVGREDVGRRDKEVKNSGSFCATAYASAAASLGKMRSWSRRFSRAGRPHFFCRKSNWQRRSKRLTSAETADAGRRAGFCKTDILSF